MQHKFVPLLIKGADDDSGAFTALVSVFDNLDHDGDIVRRGAFSKSLCREAHADVAHLEHEADDPCCYVGEVVEATQTDDGPAIKGRFDLDTEFGKSAHRKHQGPQLKLRVSAARCWT